MNSAGTHIFGNAIMATRMLRVAVSRDVLANILFKSNPPGPLITDKHGFDERFVFAEIFAKSVGPRWDRFIKKCQKSRDAATPAGRHLDPNKHKLENNKNMAFPMLASTWPLTSIS